MSASVPVAYDDRPARNTTITDRGLYALLRRFAEEHLHQEEGAPLPPERLLAVDVLDPKRKPKPIALRPHFELRFMSLAFSQSGLVGMISTEQCKRVIADRFILERATLDMEQPNADWKIVAANIYQRDLKRLFDVSDSDPVAPEWASAASLLTRMEAGRSRKGPGGITIVEPNNQTKAVMLPDHQAVLELAFADVAHGDLIDPWQDRTGAHGVGNLERYIENRELRFLPKPFQAQRKEAERVIQLFAEAQAVPQPELEEAARPDRRQVTEDLAQAALDLMQARDDMTLSKVAQLLGVTHQALGPVVKRLQHETA